MANTSACQLPLYGRQNKLLAYTLVDAEDYQVLCGLRWGALFEGGKPAYARRAEYSQGVQVVTLLHRLLLSPPAGMVVDHINHDGLDNRRSNLRLATHAQNACNRQRVHNEAGYKGVYRNSAGNFTGRIKVSGVVTSLGTYEDAVSAALAYDAAARQLFGEFAFTNFPAGFKPERPGTVRLLSLPHQGVSAGLIARRYARPRRKPSSNASQPSLFEGLYDAY